MEEKITMTSAGGVELNYEIAGLGGRSYAFIIDWHIRFIIAFVWIMSASFLFSGSFNVESMADIDSSGLWYLFLGIIPPILIYLFYHLVLEIAMNGRTPGKRMAGVRIVAKDGATASTGAILVRNIFRLIDMLPTNYMLGLIVAMFSKQNLRIGDMAAGTVLIYEEKINRKGIDKLVASHSDSNIPADKLELITELLERWKGLERPTRIKLASQLLQQLGLDVPQEAKPKLLDKQLHAALASVLGGK